MPATLPLELIFEIAGILHQAGDCLVSYTTVCRRWQAAFEPFIYSNLIVYSDDAYKGDQKGISLAHFQKATTGSGLFRRAWIKRLQYDVLVPFELLDWTTHKKEGYSVDNPVREANDQAFQTAITALFETLSSWNQSHRLSLELGLLGRQMGEEPEPHTWGYEDAGEYRLYAFLVDNSPGVSELFNNAPRSLKVLNYSNQYEAPWKSALPALNVLSTETDTFTINLRALSTVLQELKLYNTSLSSDFLWPLDKAGRPLPNSGTLQWPNLTIIELNDVPPFLPSGKWLALPTPEEQAGLDEPDEEISSPDDVIWDYDRGYASRKMVDDEEYHRFFTSMGRAARHMPRLKSIKFHLQHSTRLNFSFQPDSDPITAEWHSRAIPAYHPDERVAEAWGFPIEDFHFDPEEFDTVVNFDCWPPGDV
ncbi:hypothetical protein F9C07_2259939, partial [Aspergillus flavus]